MSHKTYNTPEPVKPGRDHGAESKEMSEELQFLFDRYNRLYWRGRLPRYRVQAAGLDGSILGRCDLTRRTIEIDVSKHKNPRHVRSTLLHEMVHAATRSGHDIKFFAQMERLLSRRALVTIETGDAGGVRFYSEVVPHRFPLLRKKMQKLEARRISKIERYAAKKTLGTEFSSGDDDIVSNFQDAEIAAFPWTRALRAMGTEYGLTDETGRPINAWARRIIAKAKPVHRKAHRNHLEHQKLWRAIRSGRIETVKVRETASGPKYTFVEDARTH
jgi:hypothetical protein